MTAASYTSKEYTYDVQQVWEQIEELVRYQICNQIHIQVRNQVNDQLGLTRHLQITRSDQALARIRDIIQTECEGKDG